jgi:transglutaminase-like putative cysteine protease
MTVVTPRTRPQAPIAVVNTIVTAAGCALGILPIGALFTDNRWFMESLGAIILVAGPAVLLRLRRSPASAQLVPGLILLIVYAFVLYVNDGSIFGLIPSSETLHRLHDLQRQTRDIIVNGSTPLKSTAGLRLYVVPLVGLLTALTDWLANVRRSPALAGIGFLTTFTVVGAIRGSSVTWWQFVFAAIGYLLVLVTASRRETAEWGRLVPRVGQTRDTPLQLSASGARIGAIAVVLAVVVPAFVPGLGRNLLLETFRGGGAGGRAGVSISEFADLAGELRQQRTEDWLRVHVEGNQGAPFYLRQKVLTTFTTAGWRTGLSGTLLDPSKSVLADSLDDAPTNDYRADINVLSLKDDAPIFGQPTSFDRLRNDWLFDTTKLTLTDSTTRTGESYTEFVSEPAPTVDQLRAAPPISGPQPGVDEVPNEVRQIVANVIKGASTPYEKTLALVDYFLPSNGFSYDLRTKSGDTGSALLDFLHNRVGFCQQYAAALAIMLRIAGLPARVVLGFTHGKLDSAGNVTITNHDAHAWVEARFAGVGWIPFDPTPLSGTDAERGVELPWAPKTGTTSSSASSAEPSVNTLNPEAKNGPTSTSSQAGGAGGGSGRLHLPVGWLAAAVGVALVLVVLALPAELRRRQRVTRYRTARTAGTFGPIWQELHATTVDTGVPWPAPTTPRQVPGWLGQHGVGRREDINRLAGEVEREFYAEPASASVPAGGSTDVQRRLAEAMETVRSARHDLLGRVRWRRRLRMAIWPASRRRRFRWRRRKH